LAARLLWHHWRFVTRRPTIFLLPEQNHGDSNLFIVQRSHGGMARITLLMARVQVGIKTSNKDSL
jgi:hypothetical protein